MSVGNPTNTFKFKSVVKSWGGYGHGTCHCTTEHAHTCHLLLHIQIHNLFNDTASHFHRLTEA